MVSRSASTLNDIVVSRGRTAALLAGNKSKKRKLNEISSEEEKMEDNEADHLKKQLDDLQGNYNQALAWIHTVEKEHL
jgi:hypothetical protein